MAIGSIGQGLNASALSSYYSSSAHKNASAVGTSAGSKKDTAFISEAAKELAALKSGKSSQEEATESLSVKLQEQNSGEE